jgi:hypothetical protein
MSGDDFLKKAQTMNTYTINELRGKLGTDEAMFDELVIDYIVVQLYAEFESDFKKIIEIAIETEKPFLKNYVSFVNKKIHPGLGENRIKQFVEIFLQQQKVEKFIGVKEWKIYSDFIDFRNHIAHACEDSEYKSKKDKLKANINDIEDLIKNLQQILFKLKHACEETKKVC